MCTQPTSRSKWVGEPDYQSAAPPVNWSIIGSDMPSAVGLVFSAAIWQSENLSELTMLWHSDRRNPRDCHSHPRPARK